MRMLHIAQGLRSNGDADAAARAEKALAEAA